MSAATGIRARGKGVWQVQVPAGRDPITGKRRQKWRTVHGTKADAQKARARLLLEVGVGGPGTDAPVDHLTAEWLAVAEHRLEPGTMRFYRQKCAHLPAWFRELPVAKVKPADIDRVYRDLADRGVQPATILGVHRTLRAAFSQAVKWEWTARNPVVASSPPRHTPTEVAPPSPDTILRFMTAAADQRGGARLHLWIRLAAITGARRSELAGIRWCDLDLDVGTLTIHGQAEGTKAGEVTWKARTKTGRPRKPIALDADTVALLRSHRARRATVALAAGIVIPAESFVLSADLDGRTPPRPDYATHAWTMLRRRLDADGVRLHDLRHYVASLLLDAGTPIKTVQERLGHSTAQTTLNIYGHFIPESDQTATRTIAASLERGRSVTGRGG